MNRIHVMLLAAILLLGLVGCGPAESEPQPKNFTFSYNGTQITMHSDADPIIAALGEPKSYTEEPSCAFDGMDKTYYYGSFYLSTYPLDGQDHVKGLWFADDSIATGDGIRIGNTQADVERIFGADCFSGTNAYSQFKGESKLTILLTDGIVSSIQYEAVIG